MKQNKDAVPKRTIEKYKECKHPAVPKLNMDYYLRKIGEYGIMEAANDFQEIAEKVHKYYNNEYVESIKRSNEYIKQLPGKLELLKKEKIPNGEDDVNEILLNKK